MAEPINFIVRAAVADESNIGSIWIGGPNCAQTERALVKMRRQGDWWWRAVYVDARTIEPNFLDRYNDDPKKRRIPILTDGHHAIEQDTIVMAEWYRRAFGFKCRTLKDNKTCRQELRYHRVRWYARWFGWIRASCQSPDPVVRLATRLGVLGAWLGLFGLIDPVQKMLCGTDMCNSFSDRLMSRLGLANVTERAEQFHAAANIVVLLAVGAMLCWVCRGRPLPKVR